MPFRWKSTRFLGNVDLSVFVNIFLLTSDLSESHVHRHYESSHSEKSLVVGSDASECACDVTVRRSFL